MAKFDFYGASVRADRKSFNPRLVVLATEAADQVALLAVMVQAYTALEKIVVHDRDSLERSATREGLGSLMRVLNVEMGRQLDLLIHSTTALHDAAVEDSRDR